MRVCLHFTSALWVFAGGLLSVAQAGETVVVPYNQSWKFLHPMGTSPAVIGDDPDYDSTWWLDEENFSSLYNGPEFGVPQIGVPANTASINSGTGSGPLGYGAVDNWNGINTPLLVPYGESFPILSMGSFLTTPRDGNRKASYYRTTFFTSDLMLKPLIRCMIDDGAVIFLDGVQVARVNLELPSPSSLPLYGTQALGDGVANGVVPAVPQSTENTLLTIDLTRPGDQGTPGGLKATVINPVANLPMGPHTLAVFVSSYSPSNSDQLMALEMTADDGGISPQPTNITRNLSGTPTIPGDDTFEFDLTVTQLSGGSSGWAGSLSQLPTGNYGQTYHLSGFPVNQPVSIEFYDIDNPALTAFLQVSPPPPPLWLGQNRIQNTPLLSAPGVSAKWIQAGGETVRHSDGGGAASEMLSTVVAIPPSGAEFQAIVEFEDTSISSNFEAVDSFEAYLLLNNGEGTTTVNLMPVALDQNGDGAFNGYSGGNYNDNTALDEFNLAARLAGSTWKEGIALNYTIPPGIVSAQFKVRAINDDLTEAFWVKNVSIAPAGTVFDLDADGAPDSDELLAGTNPTNAASVFRSVHSQTASGIELVFPTANDRSYRVISSADMENWVQLNTLSIVGDGTDQSFVVPTFEDRKFITVQVRRGQTEWTAP